MPANSKPFLTVFLFFFLGLLRLSSIPGLIAATVSVPGLYVFGDSLVDAGNNNYLTISISKANYPHNGIDFPNKKPTGRFCNGKNAADAIAEKLGLPLPPPDLSLRGLFKREERKSAVVTGVNFASGGAGIFNSSDDNYKQAIPLSHQVEHWLDIHEELVKELGPTEAQIHLSKSLFTIVIGSNDLFDYFGSFKLRKQSNPEQYTQLMADELKKQLKRIHETGARKFFIVGVAQIGCVPGKREKNTTVHKCDEEANMWSSFYNKALLKMLQEVKEETQGSLNYSYFDNFKSIHDIISNPIRHGFVDVTSACCGRGKLNAELPCLPIAKYCSDRTKHFFWDLYGHPTEAAARVSVDLMFTDNSGYSFPLTLNQLLSSSSL